MEAKAPTIQQVLTNYLQTPVQLQEFFSYATRYTRRSIFKMLKCRTGRLGGHHMRCPGCGENQVRINSCSLRSCCVCSSPKRSLWKQRVKSWALDCDHFHIVFTLPHELNDLMWASQRNKVALFGQLLNKSLCTLQRVAEREFGCQVGMIATLHTWGQALNRHAHVHIVMTAGGPSLTGDVWKPISADHEALHATTLAASFKKMFIRSLKKKFQAGTLDWPNEDPLFYDESEEQEADRLKAADRERLIEMFGYVPVTVGGEAPADQAPKDSQSPPADECAKDTGVACEQADCAIEPADPSVIAEQSTVGCFEHVAETFGVYPSSIAMVCPEIPDSVGVMADLAAFQTIHYLEIAEVHATTICIDTIESIQTVETRGAVASGGVVISAGHPTPGKFSKRRKSAKPKPAPVPLAKDEAQLIAEITAKDWIADVQITPPEHRGAVGVVNYLAGYISGGSIGNARMLSDDGTFVTFRIKDYRNKTIGSKRMRGTEFVRRYADHILPPGIQRVRYAGVFGTGKRKQLIPRCRELFAKYVETHGQTAAVRTLEDAAEERPEPSASKCKVCQTRMKMERRIQPITMQRIMSMAGMLAAMLLDEAALHRHPDHYDLLDELMERHRHEPGYSYFQGESNLADWQCLQSHTMELFQDAYRQRHGKGVTIAHCQQPQPPPEAEMELLDVG